MHNSEFTASDNSALGAITQAVPEDPRHHGAREALRGDGVARGQPSGALRHHGHHPALVLSSSVLLLEQSGRWTGADCSVASCSDRPFLRTDDSEWCWPSGSGVRGTVACARSGRLRSLSLSVWVGGGSEGDRMLRWGAYLLHGPFL